MNEKEELKTNDAAELAATGSKKILQSTEQAELPQEPQIEIPEVVQKLLEPISPESPTGQDASLDEEFFRLEMEIGKASPDYEVWIELASNILTGKSKDLRVAVWLSFAWYRKDKIEGIYNGFILIVELLRKYSAQLFPGKIAQRSKALLFLNTRLKKFLEKEEIDSNNAQTVLNIQDLFDEIQKLSDTQFAEQKPDLTQIFQIIESKAKSAQSILIKKEERKKETLENRKKPVIEDSVPVKSEKTAILTLKNTLKFFFEQQDNGKKILKVPVNDYIYGMSRLLIWNNVMLPPNKEKITEIEGPNKQRQDYIIKLFTNNDWDTLIPTIEIDFLNHAGFKFWFDAQRLVVQALEQKGGVTVAADEIKIQLDKLIIRAPGLSRLMFKDKQTPFADKETLTWLDDEVQGFSGGGKAADKILPPIMGEDYEPINKEYEASCSELPENFDKNAQTMQKSIEGDIRRKGRFLRILNLANFCYTAKQYELAKVFLNQLMIKIENYQLTEWEPALCVAVWQSAYLTNIKLAHLENDKNKNLSIEQEQEDLFKKIGNYDGVLALKLMNRKPKIGE